MNTTINISIPKKMLDDAKKYATLRGYGSLSELIRDTLRGKLYMNLTENGFTPEEEDEILRIAASDDSQDEVWETEEDVDRFFDKVEKEVKKIKAKKTKND
ncbi:hypothetical protein C4579_00630 [Candidatus Microgenomates bacterium]|nr:MAG: hypothetical protein C4579_00630 [Candidatus Microgenomates bacterium]